MCRHGKHLSMTTSSRMVNFGALIAQLGKTYASLFRLFEPLLRLCFIPCLRSALSKHLRRRETFEAGYNGGWAWMNPVSRSPYVQIDTIKSYDKVFKKRSLPSSTKIRWT